MTAPDRMGSREQGQPAPRADYSGEAHLARAAARGDRSAQERLFEHLGPRLHATLYRVLGSNEHIEDLLQEALIEVFRSLSSFRAQAKLSTWADRIAVRVVYRFFARERARGRVTSEHSVEDCQVNSLDDDLCHRQAVRKLYRALDEMKPDLRIAFALLVIEGRTLKEVAAATGASVVAVKSRVWRARRALASTSQDDPVLAQYLSADRS